MRNPNKKPLTVQTVLKQLLCLFLSLIVLAPLYLVLINSFKTKSEAARMNLSLPTQWVFSNYPDVFKKANLLTGLGNSLLYAFVSTAAGVLLCAMAAYVLSRKRTKLNNFIYYFFICGLFFPVNYITLVRVFQWMGLTNTRRGIVLVFTSAMIPFCVFTIYSFVETIPKEAYADDLLRAAVHGRLERLPDAAVPVLEEQAAPDDHVGVPVLRQGGQQLELRVCRHRADRHSRGRRLRHRPEVYHRRRDCGRSKGMTADEALMQRAGLCP